MANKPWGGRFGEKTDRRVEEFSESISFDRRLFEHDIRGSIAHAAMLAAVGLITADECQQIDAGLTEIRAEIEAGTFAFILEREDIHMHVEAALIDRLGDVGRKLHTARSRNDQVATDFKLWTRDALDRIDARLVDLQRAYVAAAERHRDLILPGYTHLQRAQPVLAAHYFLAFVEKFARDRDRLADCRRRLNVLPLGAAALAGHELADRPRPRRPRPRVRRRDGQQPRHLRRPRLRRGVRLRPDPDRRAPLGLGRGVGPLVDPGVLVPGPARRPLHRVEHHAAEEEPRRPGADPRPDRPGGRVLDDPARADQGLPLAYNRDLQEDKEPLFDAFDTVDACLDLAAVVVEGATLRADRIAARLDEGYLDATTLMEYLIKQGVPQRTGHEIVGHLVGLAERQGCRLADLSDEDFAAANPQLTPEVKQTLGVANAVAAFRSYGSTAPAEVEKQLARWQAYFERDLVTSKE